MINNKTNQPMQLSNDAQNYNPDEQANHAKQKSNINHSGGFNDQTYSQDQQSYSSSFDSQSSDQQLYQKSIQRQIKQQHLKFNSNDNQTQQQQLLNQTTGLHSRNASKNLSQQYSKLDRKINMQKINNQVTAMEAKQLVKQKKNKDKADRATVQQVLDERTRKILLKYINNQTVHEINGCLSTGKEANVYHSINNTTKKEYAIKIYKTSILIFKDRDRYVSGQFRFRRGYCASNPRKMVAKWAQKQLRNLKRIQGVIPSPVGLSVKSNVLMMDFIGKDMKPAPKLRQVQGDVQKFSQIYLEVIQDMRILYQQCKLIHADLSEYNLLYWDNKIYVIDVSQSVEHDHPHALDFLRRDIFNINEFFRKKKVHVFRDWNVFQFIVALGIPKGKQRDELLRIVDEFIQQEQQNSKINQQDHQHKVRKTDSQIQDLIFKKITIPRLLGNLSLEKVQKQIFQKPYNQSKFMQAVTGVEKDYRTDKQIQQAQIIQTTIRQQKQQHDQNSDSSSNSSSDSDLDNNGQNNQSQNKQEEEGNDQKVGGKQKYDGLSKNQRKHKVKQQKRQKRKDKIPKKVKRKMTKKK